MLDRVVHRRGFVVARRNVVRWRNVGVRRQHFVWIGVAVALAGRVVDAVLRDARGRIRVLRGVVMVQGKTALGRELAVPREILTRMAWVITLAGHISLRWAIPWARGEYALRWERPRRHEIRILRNQIGLSIVELVQSLIDDQMIRFVVSQLLDQAPDYVTAQQTNVLCVCSFIRLCLSLTWGIREPARSRFCRA